MGLSLPHADGDAAGAAPARLSEQAPPGPGEALVRVRRIGVCGTDFHAFKATSRSSPTRGSLGTSWAWN